MSEALGVGVKGGVVIATAILPADPVVRAAFLAKYAPRFDVVVQFPDAAAPGVPGMGWTTTDGGATFAPPVSSQPSPTVDPRVAIDAPLIVVAQAALAAGSGATAVQKTAAATYLRAVGAPYA